MNLNHALSLDALLIAHARILSIQNEPKVLATLDNLVRRKAHRTDAKVRLAAMKAAHDLATAKRYLGEGLRKIRA